MKTLNLKTGIKAIFLGMGFMALTIVTAKANGNESALMVKLVHPKIENSLKLNNELKQKIKNENVEVFFEVNENPKVKHTEGNNNELNQFVTKQFEGIVMPELLPNKTYQISINYKVL